MKLIIKETADNATAYVAQYIISKINAHKLTNSNQLFTLGLPTGSAAVKIFKELVKLYNEKQVSFENVQVVNMDEFCNLDTAHSENHSYFLYQNLLNFINIKKENIHFLNGNSDNLEQECINYENFLKQNKVDLFIGGMGPDGHIAHNGPFTSLSSKTRILQLSNTAIQNNSKAFNNDITKTPSKVLTIGVATLLENVKEILLCATGTSKAKAISKVVDGSINHKWIASSLQIHTNSIIVCDKEAAHDLENDTIENFLK